MYSNCLSTISMTPVQSDDYTYKARMYNSKLFYCIIKHTYSIFRHFRLTATRNKYNDC